MQDGTGEGPAVYQRARAHSAMEAVRALERAAGQRVVQIEKSTVGASHAVYLVTFENGQTAVARFATDPEHALERELWATEQARSVGVPAPALLLAEHAPEDGSPPFALHERLPGSPGKALALTAAERLSVLEEMGRIAARLHRRSVPGVGHLIPAGEDYAGSSASWWHFTREALERRLGELPKDTVPVNLAARIRQAFAAGQPALAAAFTASTTGTKDAVGTPGSVLVHGDFRLKNALLDRDAAGRVWVSGVVDFEMALAGDGAVDLAWLFYEDGHGEQDLTAILRGYGASPADQLLRQRLLLYQLHYALGHLWWEVSFKDTTAIAAVLQRIYELLNALARAPHV